MGNIYSPVQIMKSYKNSPHKKQTETQKNNSVSNRHKIRNYNRKTNRDLNRQQKEYRGRLGKTYIQQLVMYVRSVRSKNFPMFPGTSPDRRNNIRKRNRTEQKHYWKLYNFKL